jgi:hypothetical protein
MSKIHLYQIAYDAKTKASVPPGFGMLDNLSGLRNDWREYWPIRHFLLNETMDEASYYGFFSPRFLEKTGHSFATVSTFVEANRDGDFDVFSISPQADMGAFFLNVFEQEELFQPGFKAASTTFFDAIGLPQDLERMVMDSRHIIFSNYFIARPAFWRAWLDMNEQLFDYCEGRDSPVKAVMTEPTAYPGAVQRKVFLMERIASLILAIDPQWKCKAFNPFMLAWSASRLNQFRHEAVVSDALKMAIRDQGYPEYYEAYSAMRDKLR